MRGGGREKEKGAGGRNPRVGCEMSNFVARISGDLCDDPSFAYARRLQCAKVFFFF